VDGFRLGLDYGTSHTVAVLRWPDGKTRALIVDGSPLMPSAVYADVDGRLVVGRDAERGARLDPARLERNPKRRIDDGEVLLGGQSYAVADLIAGTMRRIVDEAVRTAGVPLSQTVLTCPAAWGPVRRRVLLEAAARGGLALPSLLPEPVAAATYFANVLGRHVPVDGCVVVYDLGAGTFDASVVRRTPTGFETLACQGIDNFGGLDLDALLAARIGEMVGAADPTAWQRLTHPADAADRRHFSAFWEDVRLSKETLSRHMTASMHVPLLDRDAFVTREEFEALAKPGLAGTIEVTLSAISDARVRPDELAGVFLVGGSTRIPLIATLLHRAIGVAPALLEQPELVVAEGALLANQPRFQGVASARGYQAPSAGQGSAGPVSAAPAPVSAVPMSPAPMSPAPMPAASVSATPISPVPMSPGPAPGAPYPAPPMPPYPAPPVPAYPAPARAS
jgi:molecular chaperone DnaK (HSP70)